MNSFILVEFKFVLLTQVNVLEIDNTFLFIKQFQLKSYSKELTTTCSFEVHNVRASDVMCDKMFESYINMMER